MSANSGGPAFPPMHDPETHAFGMTLRDYFAAKAMAELMSLPSFALGYDPEQVADSAYEFADSMLKARQS